MLCGSVAQWPTGSDTMTDSQRKVAETIGIPVARRHIFLCADQTTPKCCDKERGIAAWDFLKKRLTELGLANQGGILRSKTNCLRICEGGPDCARLSRGRVVRRVRSARPRAHHPGALDRRTTRRRPADHHASSAAGTGVTMDVRPLAVGRDR
jgi:hypothetical protein